MKIQHDREADALYIELRDETPDYVIDVPGFPGLSVDVRDDGTIVGIEMLHVKKRLRPEDMSEITFEDLVGEQTEKIQLAAFDTGKPSRRAS